MSNKPEEIGSLVQRLENEYTRGNTQISDHVSFSMFDTINRIEAYLNSKHISGENDSQGRPKPFFNIVVAAANIWMRATDLDRKNIRLSAKKRKYWLDSFFANVLLQDWMRHENFGQFLNEWGRVLARYGSAMVKFVENATGLHISVTPWNRAIVDPISFAPNPKIEVLELNEAQLRERIDTHGYDPEQVEALISAKKPRETVDRRRKDNRPDYYRLYEVHGRFSKATRTGDLNDSKIFEYQMWVISFVGNKKKGDDDEFYLFKGKEKDDPFMITHLIPEDGRTLAIGAVEHLFEAQWMQNHSMKAAKDRLDIASKLILQTADANFVGRNVLTAVENGDVLVTMPSQPLSQVYTASNDSTMWQNYAVAWRDVGREIAGISEAMLGVTPKSGTAWHQTEAVLSESYSLFENMTENKGLYLEQMLRERILPYLFSKYDNAEEISATLEKHDITRLDSMYVKNEAIRRTNADIISKALEGEVVTPEQQASMNADNEAALQGQLEQLGSQRFFAPTDISWKKQFENIEWDIDIDITGEEENIQDIFTTLNTALKLVMTPGFDQNPKAQAIVGRILDMSGAITAVEYNSLPSSSGQSTGAASAEFKAPAGAGNTSGNQ